MAILIYNEVSGGYTFTSPRAESWKKNLRTWKW